MSIYKVIFLFVIVFINAEHINAEDCVDCLHSTNQLYVCDEQRLRDSLDFEKRKFLSLITKNDPDEAQRISKNISFLMSKLKSCNPEITCLSLKDDSFASIQRTREISEKITFSTYQKGENLCTFMFTSKIKHHSSDTEVTMYYRSGKQPSYRFSPLKCSNTSPKIKREISFQDSKLFVTHSYSDQEQAYKHFSEQHKQEITEENTTLSTGTPIHYVFNKKKAPYFEYPNKDIVRVKLAMDMFVDFDLKNGSIADSNFLSNKEFNNPKCLTSFRKKYYKNHPDGIPGDLTTITPYARLRFKKSFMKDKFNSKHTFMIRNKNLLKRIPRERLKIEERIINHLDGGKIHPSEVPEEAINHIQETN